MGREPLREHRNEARKTYLLIAHYDVELIEHAHYRVEHLRVLLLLARAPLRAELFKERLLLPDHIERLHEGEYGARPIAAVPSPDAFPEGDHRPHYAKAHFLERAFRARERLGKILAVKAL